MQPQFIIKTHSYQSNPTQIEISLPYYLQQYKVAKTPLPSFTQIPNTAELLRMTLKPYFMAGSSITPNKPLMVFTGTDLEYSVEDYLKAVTAKLILNIGPEPENTRLHQNWVHKRRALN